MPTGIYTRKPRPSLDPRPRFLTFVPDRPVEGCWPWQGAITHDDYGQFWWNGRKIHAHRAAYLLFIGPIPHGQFALHHCDTPGCVRWEGPSHIFAGTQSDNIRDAWTKRRNAFNARPQPGERNGNHVLTEHQVRLILLEYQPGHAGTPSTTSLRALAARYNVSKFCIQSIVKGLTWRHLRDSVVV